FLLTRLRHTRCPNQASDCLGWQTQHGSVHRRSPEPSRVHFHTDRWVDSHRRDNRQIDAHSDPRFAVYGYSETSAPPWSLLIGDQIDHAAKQLGFVVHLYPEVEAAALLLSKVLLNIDSLYKCNHARP